VLNPFSARFVIEWGGEEREGMGREREGSGSERGGEV